jgi:ParB family chromosome partitioning protein
VIRFRCGSEQAVTQSRICADADLRLGGSAAFQRKRAAPVFVTGWKPRESLSAPVAETIPMATAVQKITLSSSRDIPFNKLVLSQSNVRRVKAGVSIEELAEDIARRTLLQGLNVRPVLDAEGIETGMFEVPAGGRRYRALQLLVKQKRLAKTAPVPCVVRDPSVEISAEEDSLAENVHRAPLHPLDQFRAFQALRQKGQSEEEIAAAFFVGVNVVKQRLRLAAVSEKLLDVYAEDGMSLDQLMAFTVTTDHTSPSRSTRAVGSPPVSREAIVCSVQVSETKPITPLTTTTASTIAASRRPPVISDSTAVPASNATGRLWN